MEEASKKKKKTVLVKIWSASTVKGGVLRGNRDIHFFGAGEEEKVWVPVDECVGGEGSEEVHS